MGQAEQESDSFGGGELVAKAKLVTEEEYAKFYELYGQGLNDREIAEATGRCGTTICLWRKREGLMAVGKREAYEARQEAERQARLLAEKEREQQEREAEHKRRAEERARAEADAAERRKKRGKPVPWHEECKVWMSGREFVARMYPGWQGIKAVGPGVAGGRCECELCRKRRAKEQAERNSAAARIRDRGGLIPGAGFQF